MILSDGKMKGCGEGASFVRPCDRRPVWSRNGTSVLCARDVIVVGSSAQVTTVWFQTPAGPSTGFQGAGERHRGLCDSGGIWWRVLGSMCSSGQLGCGVLQVVWTLGLAPERACS